MRVFFIGLLFFSSLFVLFCFISLALAGTGTGTGLSEFVSFFFSIFFSISISLDRAAPRRHTYKYPSRAVAAGWNEK